MRAKPRRHVESAEAWGGERELLQKQDDAVHQAHGACRDAVTGAGTTPEELCETPLRAAEQKRESLERAEEALRVEDATKARTAEEAHKAEKARTDSAEAWSREREFLQEQVDAL